RDDAAGGRPRQRRRPVFRGDRSRDRRVPGQLPAGPQPPRVDQRNGGDPQRRASLGGFGEIQSVLLAILDLECEARQALEDRAVELFLVGLGRLLVERGGKVVAQVGQQLGAGL